MQKPDNQEWTTLQLLSKYISAMEIAGGENQGSGSTSGHASFKHFPFKTRPLQHRSAEGLLAASAQQLPQASVCIVGKTTGPMNVPSIRHYKVGGKN